MCPPPLTMATSHLKELVSMYSMYSHRASCKIPKQCFTMGSCKIEVPKGLASVMTQHPKWSRGITLKLQKKMIAVPKVMDLAVQTGQTSGWKGRWKVCPGSCFLSPPSTKNSGTNQPSKPRSWPRVTFPLQHLVARSIYKHGNRIAQGQPSQQKPRRIKLTQKKICSSPGISLWNWQNNCTQLSTSTATTSGSQSLQLQFWEFGPVSWA